VCLAEPRSWREGTLWCGHGPHGLPPLVVTLVARLRELAVTAILNGWFHLAAAITHRGAATAQPLG
jgi:hypothetical protein